MNGLLSEVISQTTFGKDGRLTKELDSTIHKATTTTAKPATEVPS